MLKRRGEDGARRANYHKQREFRGANSEMRGKVVELLLNRSPVAEKEVIDFLNQSALQVRKNLEQMQKDNFVDNTGDMIRFK